MSIYKDFWNQQETSCRDSETFDPKRKAKEFVSFMTPKERSLSAIDIGCGGGELLYYLSDYCNVQEALDYSTSLVKIASQRLYAKRIKICEKDISVSYKEIQQPIWLTAGAFNQYVPPSKVTEIIEHFARQSHTESFFLFDTIDPAAYRIWQTRLYTYLPSRYQPTWIRKGYYLSKLIFESFRRRLWFQLEGPMGYAYRPYFWHQLAKQAGLKCEIVSSLFLEYRYHVILRKSPE